MIDEDNARPPRHHNFKGRIFSLKNPSKHHSGKDQPSKALKDPPAKITKKTNIKAEQRKARIEAAKAAVAITSNSMMHVSSGSSSVP